MSDINRVVIKGRLVRDPSAASTTDGVSIASFTIACGRIKKEEVDYIDCKAFRHNADFLTKYAHKGDTVVIDGRLQKRSYKNKQDVTVYVTEVMAEYVDLISANRQAKTAETSEDIHFNTGDVNAVNPDDLPF